MPWFQQDSQSPSPKRMPLARGLLLVVLVALGLLCSGGTAEAASRIKDIAEFEGVRDNQLIGYGLVVGLNGTGDTIRNSPFT